jgi:hypothetical protein
VPITTSESLAYGIANQNIYRLEPISFSYTPIFTLPAAADAYNFRSLPGRLIVAASRRTNPTPNSAIKVNQVFYVFADPPNGALRLLGQFDINSTLVIAPTNNDNIDKNIFLVPFSTSHSLSKLAVVFNPLSEATNLPRTTLLRSIDWSKGTVSNFTFADQIRFFNTNARLKADNQDLIIGDNFFVIRNQSAYNASTAATSVIVEETYQHMRDQSLYLRSRSLTEADKNSFRRFFIDATVPTQLSTITVVENPFEIHFTSFNYGNLALTNKVTPAPIPAYISFAIPPNTAAYRTEGLGWIYKTVAANKTNSTYI